MLFVAIITISCTKDETNQMFEQQQSRALSVKEITTTVPGCQTTINTGITLSISGNQYTADFTGVGDTINVVYNDVNGGSITNGDTITFTSIRFTSCGSRHQIRTNSYSIASVTSPTITINYTDCLLPLNGLNGTIQIKMKQ